MLSPEYRTNIHEMLRMHSEQRPFIMAEIGQGRPLVAVTAATHGDEAIGVHVLNNLKDGLQLTRGTARFIIANPPALARGVRYREQDLNRIYPGVEGAKGEAGIAPQVLRLIGDADYVIDLHSTSSETESFAIVTGQSEEQLRLAEMTGVKNIVLIPRKGQGYAMVDYVTCGIGIELGLHGSQDAYESGNDAITRIFSRLRMIEGQRIEGQMYEYFEIVGAIPKGPVQAIAPYVSNFSLVRKGDTVAAALYYGDVIKIKAEEDFYPVLIGERAYPENICLMAQKVSREEIVKKGRA